MSENKIVLISKEGTVETKTVKNLDFSSIFKKCSFRNDKDFDFRHMWKVKLNKEQYNIAFYGKNKGFANTENKYDLPPPLDSTLFFGKCLLIRLKDDADPKNFSSDEINDFNSEEWEKIYEKLFGGFEDLGGVDQDKQDELEDKDELEDVPDDCLTKQGYLLDGFVVDSEGTDSDESYKPKKKTKARNKKIKLESKKEESDKEESDKEESGDEQEESGDEQEESGDEQEESGDEQEESGDEEEFSSEEEDSELVEEDYDDYSDSECSE